VRFVFNVSYFSLHVSGYLEQKVQQTMKPRIEPNPPLRRSVSSIEVSVLSVLFDAAPDIAFFVKDVEGRYVVVNDSLSRRHGLRTKAEAIGKRPSDLCQGDFGQVPENQDSHVLRTGRSLVDHLEMQWNRPHDPIWCITTKLPIHGDDGQVCGLVGFSRDVRVPLERDEIPQGFAAAVEEFELTLADDIRPAWIARRSDLTSQQLTRLMKKIFGLTPSQFITRIRIAAGSRRLLETRKTVSEIANECGFCDHSAFTRAFKNATGVTPTAFRDK